MRRKGCRRRYDVSLLERRLRADVAPCSVVITASSASARPSSAPIWGRSHLVAGSRASSRSSSICCSIEIVISVKPRRGCPTLGAILQTKSGASHLFERVTLLCCFTPCRIEIEKFLQNNSRGKLHLRRAFRLLMSTLGLVNRILTIPPAFRTKLCCL